jgi:TolB protein
MDPGAPATYSDIFVAKVLDLLEGVMPTNITFEDPLVRVFINDDPEWSPRGRKIVFTRHLVIDNPEFPPFNYPTAEIWVINANGTGLERLTFNSEEERSPAWSPDGTQIVYSCRKKRLFADLRDER